MKNIVILISGGGSNMAAIVRAAQRDHWARTLGARVAAVISNRADAAGLAYAREQGIATAVLDHTSFGSREGFDAALAALIDRQDPDAQPALVVLAGFMRVLTPKLPANKPAARYTLVMSTASCFKNWLPQCLLPVPLAAPPP